MRLPKFLRRTRSELEVENALLKQQLASAGLLVWYYSSTRRPCDGRCTPPLPKPKARHRWKTLHAPTEVLPRALRR